MQKTMHRREFIKKLAAGMAAGWAYKCWPGAFSIAGNAVATPGLVIACLADPHLRDGDGRRPEALALARAVAEIRNLTPSPHLVLFAGDLAHDGNASALALGEEILSDLSTLVLAVRGEGDRSPGKGRAGWPFSDDGRFFYTCEEVNLLGLDTVWQDGPDGPGFALGESQQRWLGEILARLEPAAPLIVLSHAPLIPIYRPWGQWTVDSGPLLSHLSRFENVLYLHGHVHHSGGVCFQGQAAPGKTPPPLAGGGWGEGGISPCPEQTLAQSTPSPTLPHQGGGRENCAWGGLQHISLPATSWPLPSPLTGTPRKLTPGLGPRGCGWALLQPGGPHPQFRQVLWKA
jgi:Icc protein